MNTNFINILIVIAIAFILLRFYADHISSGNARISENSREHFTQEYRERLMKQLKEGFRRIVICNEMDRNIELTFLLKEPNGEEFSVQHYIGSNDSGQIPYFVPGVLYVAHGENVASVDISDVTKEYIFTVHSDGSVTQVTQDTRE